MQLVLKERYKKNKNIISDRDQQTLAHKKVVIIGLGGLGGFVLEQLTRVGVGHLVGYDHDVFDVSNLNRQRFSNEHSLYQHKATVAQQECRSINSDITIECFSSLFDEQAFNQHVGDTDVFIDATDSIMTKVTIATMCKKHNKTYVVGAIGGHLGQVMVYFHNHDDILSVYANHHQGIEKELGNPVYTPAIIATIMVKSVVDVLLSRLEVHNKHWMIDLDDMMIMEVKKK